MTTGSDLELFNEPATGPWVALWAANDFWGEIDSLDGVCITGLTKVKVLKIVGLTNLKGVPAENISASGLEQILGAMVA